MPGGIELDEVDRLVTDVPAQRVQIVPGTGVNDDSNLIERSRGLLLDRIVDGCARSMAMSVAALLLDRDPRSIGVCTLLEQLRLEPFGYDVRASRATILAMLDEDEPKLKALVELPRRMKFWRDKEGGHIHRRNVDDLSAFDRELKTSQLSLDDFEGLLRGMRAILDRYFPVLRPEQFAAWNWEVTDAFGQLMQELAQVPADTVGPGY